MPWIVAELDLMTTPLVQIASLMQWRLPETFTCWPAAAASRTYCCICAALEAVRTTSTSVQAFRLL